MSIDKKKLMSQSEWDGPVNEQEAFGNQSPFASSASISPLPDFETPTVPLLVPADTPPIYTTTQVVPVPPYRHPQSQHYDPHVSAAQPQPRPPQHYPSQQPYQTPYPQQQQQYQEHTSPNLHSQQYPYPSSNNASDGYGATSYSAPGGNSHQQTPNHNGYYALPKGLNDGDGGDSEADIPYSNLRRRKRKKESCCRSTCCCLVILLFIILITSFWDRVTFTNSSCNIPQNYETREVNHAIAASPDLALAFETLDGIVGDIVVKESESMDNQNVHIRIVMSATSDAILNQMEGGIHEGEHNVRSWVHLKDSNSNGQKRKLLFGNCARADVEIIYPRVKPGTKSLKVKTTVGNLSVRMDSKRSEPIFESIVMEVVNGVIDFKHVIVSKKTSLKVINGQIRGSLRTAGTLSVETVNAPVDLAVDTTPLAPDWNPLDDFQAGIRTINGPATLSLANPFYGKFSLRASVKRPSITLPYNTKDVVKYDTNKWNELEGWISKDGTQNALGHAQVDIQTVNGVIKLGIQG